MRISDWSSDVCSSDLLPPHWHFNRERLVQFLELLPDDMRHVFEFRDPTWITEEVLELLGEKGASFCAHDMPNVPTPRWATGPIAYVRFHGASGKYWGRYSKEIGRATCRERGRE